MSSLDSLSYVDRAAFAVASRLLSCIITESLLKALFVPMDSSRAAGVCVVLSKKVSAMTVPFRKPYAPTDVFVIVPLRTTPIIKQSSHFQFGLEIGLVDPLDMLPWMYEVRDDPNLSPDLKSDFPTAILSSLPLLYYGFARHTTLSLSLDPLYLWEKFSAEIRLHPANQDAIARELQSSIVWQKYAYENCPQRPTLESTSMEWERALIEGHPTHPMHRARMSISPLPASLPGQYDFYHPRVRFLSIPRSRLSIQGNFEGLLGPLIESAATNAARPLNASKGQVLFPVHELQIPNIIANFPDARILPEEFSVLAPAQASIRTLTLPCSPELTLKLALGIRISSALRTISHFTAYAGPRFGRDVVPHLAINRDLLIIENEVASVVYAHEDPEIAKNCTAVIREIYNGEKYGECVVIAAALAETGYGDRDDNAPTAVTALGLDTIDKRINFLERYINMIFDAFLPPLLINGVAFEAHGQNTLARFNKLTGELTGFVYRDFGGLKVHVPTLFASTGVILDTLPEHCIVVDDVHDAQRRLYHTLIHSHLHRLIRVLGFHHDGRGWELVRKSLEARVPQQSSLWHAWLDPARTTVMGKCLLRMKLQGLYRDVIYEAVPNLIHYRPQAQKTSSKEKNSTH